MRTWNTFLLVLLLIACGDGRKQYHDSNQSTNYEVGAKPDDTTTDTRISLPPPTFLEFIANLPPRSLPLRISCGLEETVSVEEYSRFKNFIPNHCQMIYGRLETNANVILVMFGSFGDDIYPSLYSYDASGQVLGVLTPDDLLINYCGAVGPDVVPHSFVFIDKALNITLVDTTRFIHYAERSTDPDDYVVDSIRVTRILKKVTSEGRFITINIDSNLSSGVL